MVLLHSKRSREFSMLPSIREIERESPHVSSDSSDVANICVPTHRMRRLRFLSDQNMDVEFLSTRAAIPAIAATSARSLASIQNNPNANPSSVFPETATVEEDLNNWLLLMLLVIRTGR